MARRFNSRYFVRISADRDFKVSAGEWEDLLTGRWIKPDSPGSRYADLKRGVVGWVRFGDLYVLALKRMQTVTASWLHAWLYTVGVMPASLVGLSYFDRQEAVLFAQERDTQNEALFWRTFRNTRGANEFAYIPAETKAQLIGAMRPDLVQA